MPAFNTPLKQPVAALWYSAFGAVALAAFILIVGLFFAFGTGNSCGGDKCALFDPAILVPLIGIVGIIIVGYPTLYWYLFSYELTHSTITVNSGILFRQYETIDFGRIQSIDNQRGPLLMLFGLTMVKIWTASADQISFTVGNNSAHAHPSPDMTLTLQKDDAARLKDFMMREKTSAGSL